jgi:sugar lactone lactonase YvrE
VPYLLLGVLALSTGLGVGLGLSEAPIRHSVHAGQVKVASTSPPAGPATIPSQPEATTSTLAPAVLQPERPGPLAIGPDGNLYVADEDGNRILQLLPGGEFQLVAGNGVAGFSGDGGPAGDAELNRPLGMVFSPSGTLYFADSGNDRVRAVSPAGTITTVAGDGQIGFWVADGTPALEAKLDPNAVAFSPSGVLYVSTGEQILRLNAGDTFINVLGTDSQFQGDYGAGGPAIDGSADGADGLAFDSADNLFVAGFNDKTLSVVTPEGQLTYPIGIGNFYPRDAGDLVETPDGSVLAGNVLSVVRLTPNGEQTLRSFQDGPFLGVSHFEVDGIAVLPNGTIYIDTYYGNGYANESAIAAVPLNGSATLLWSNP